MQIKANEVRKRWIFGKIAYRSSFLSLFLHFFLTQKS